MCGGDSPHVSRLTAAVAHLRLQPAWQQRHHPPHPSTQPWKHTRQRQCVLDTKRSGKTQGNKGSVLPVRSKIPGRYPGAPDPNRNAPEVIRATKCDDSPCLVHGLRALPSPAAPAGLAVAGADPPASAAAAAAGGPSAAAMLPAGPSRARTAWATWAMAAGGGQRR